MLALFRSKKESLKWVLWVLIVVLGAGMVLLFVNTPGGLGQTASNEVAKVAGNSIGVVEFRRHYSQVYQYYEKQFNLSKQNPSLIKQLRLGEQALNQLINTYAVAYEAKRLGIVATDQEVNHNIKSLPVFQEQGTGKYIGNARYQQILQANNLTPVEFEESVRHEILRRKLNSVLTDGIEPAPQEVRQEYVNQNQQVKIRYVAFDKEKAGASVDEGELKEYFEANSEKYKIPERRKVSYIAVPLQASKVELSEEQIQARLKDIPEVERVRASHILFKVKKGEDEAPIKKKAQRVLARLRSGADFAEMARKYSEDTSAANGGDLGFFGRGQMVPEFDKVAFSLKPGQISSLVKSPFGFHIIKVTAAPRSKEESRRMMAEFELREEEAGKQARERASTLAKELRAGAAFDRIAEREKLQAGETRFFALGDTLRSPQVRSDFNQQVFALKKGELTEPYAAANGYLIARLTEIQPARLPGFDKVEDQVRKDFSEERSEELARERAAAFFRAARDAKSLQRVAEKEGLSTTTTDFFKKGATVDETIKFSPPLHDRVFVMKEGDISPPITVAGKFVVFEVVEKTPIDEAKYGKDKDRIADRLKQDSKVAFFSAYLQNVVAQLRKDDQIVVNRKLLDALTS